MRARTEPKADPLSPARGGEVRVRGTMDTVAAAKRRRRRDRIGGVTWALLAFACLAVAAFSDGSQLVVAAFGLIAGATACAWLVPFGWRARLALSSVSGALLTLGSAVMVVYSAFALLPGRHEIEGLGFFLPVAISGFAFGLWTIFFPSWHGEEQRASPTPPSPPRAGERRG